MHNNLGNKKIDRNNILFLFLFIVILAKIIRYTVMKTVLVDNSVGYAILELIRNKNCALYFIWNNPGELSAQNTAWLFTPFYYLGIRSYIDYEIVITIIFNCFLIFLLTGSKKKLNISEALIWVLGIAVLNIFAFNLSKEPIQMLFFLGLYFVLRENISNRKQFVLSMFIILISVITYRTYYILIAVFLITIVFFDKVILAGKKVRIKHLILFIVAIYLVFVIFLCVSKIIFPTEYLELIRVRSRTGSEAISEIAPLIKSNNIIIFAINYPLSFLRLLLPLELLLSGIKYFPFVVFQLLITGKIVQTYFHYNNLSYKRKLALNIVLSFSLASCAFEPDYGSWIRHEAVTLPIMIMAFGFIKNGSRRKLRIRF